MEDELEDELEDEDEEPQTPSTDSTLEDASADSPSPLNAQCKEVANNAESEQPDPEESVLSEQDGISNTGAEFQVNLKFSSLQASDDLLSKLHSLIASNLQKVEHEGHKPTVRIKAIAKGENKSERLQPRPCLEDEEVTIINSLKEGEKFTISYGYHLSSTKRIGVDLRNHTEVLSAAAKHAFGILPFAVRLVVTEHTYFIEVSDELPRGRFPQMGAYISKNSSEFNALVQRYYYNGVQKGAQLFLRKGKYSL